VKEEAIKQLEKISEQTVLTKREDIVVAIENVDLLTSQIVYVSAMENYIEKGGGSRGSYIIAHEDNMMDFLPENKQLLSKIQEVIYTKEKCFFSWEDVKPIPQEEDWFENLLGHERTDFIAIKK